MIQISCFGLAHHSALYWHTNIKRRFSESSHIHSSHFSNRVGGIFQSSEALNTATECLTNAYEGTVSAKLAGTQRLIIPVNHTAVGARAKQLRVIRRLCKRRAEQTAGSEIFRWLSQLRKGLVVILATTAGNDGQRNIPCMILGSRFPSFGGLHED